jgi:hypothetical protein
VPQICVKLKLGGIAIEELAIRLGNPEHLNVMTPLAR